MRDCPFEKRFEHERMDDFIFAEFSHRDFDDISQLKIICAPARLQFIQHGLTFGH